MFREIIEDLSNKGLTETEMALAVGVNQATINRYKHEAVVPNYYVGVKLVALHKKWKRRKKK